MIGEAGSAALRLANPRCSCAWPIALVATEVRTPTWKLAHKQGEGSSRQSRVSLFCNENLVFRWFVDILWRNREILFSFTKKNSRSHEFLIGKPWFPGFFSAALRLADPCVADNLVSKRVDDNLISKRAADNLVPKGDLWIAACASSDTFAFVLLLSN